MSNSQESKAFIAALDDVLPHWAFHAVIGDDCLPLAMRVTTTVWFEVVDGKPKISVSSRRFTEKDKKSLPPMTRVDPIYPDHMIRENREAIVYARMEVDRDGNVTQVAAKTFATSRRTGPFRAFEAATVQALSHGKGR